MAVANPGPQYGSEGARERWSTVDRYLADLFVPAGADPALAAALDDANAAGLPRQQVSPLEGKLLYLVARLAGATSVLEIGTLGGYSTIWFGRALQAVAADERGDSGCR